MSRDSEIAALILRQGDIAASGAANHGQVLGGTLANIGQAIGSIPAQIQQRQATAQQNELTSLKIAGAKAELSDAERARQKQAAVEDVLKRHENIEDALPELYKVDPAVAATINQHVQSARKEAQALRNEQLKYETSKADFLGAQFGSATDPGSYTKALYTVKKALPDEDWSKFTGDYQTDLPLIKSAQQAAMSVKDQLTQARENEEAAARKPLLAAQTAEANARVPLIGAQAAEATARVPLVAAQTKEATARVPLIAAETAKARADAAKSGLEAGQLQQVAGAMKAGAATPDVPAGQKNDEYLKHLEPAQAAQVKALAEGRMQFPSGFALRSPYWQGMLQAVAKYDPSFDAVNYNARAKTRSDFTSGKSAQQVNAINTVIGHLSTLREAADALNNSDFPMFNRLANTVSQATGSPKVTNFNTVKKAVADEVTRVWRQAGGSVEDIKQAQANLDAAGSPAQLHEAIATYGQLLESKLASFNEQYRQGMGSDKVDILTPESKRSLDKILGASSTTAAPSKKNPFRPD